MFIQLINHTNTNPYEKFEDVKTKINALEGAYYTFDFDIPLTFDEESKIADKFWKVLKIKAKKADLFVINIKTCEFLNDSPSGFVRKITQLNSEGGVDEIRERVWINDQDKSILFIQTKTTGKVRLAAINELKKNKNSYSFVGKYVFEILKESQSQEDPKAITALKENLLKFTKIMMDNLIAFYKEGKVEETYKSYYTA